MRALGVQHFKIVCVREYTDIYKERLHNRELHYIQRYDSINTHPAELLPGKAPGQGQPPSWALAVFNIDPLQGAQLVYTLGNEIYLRGA
jgi:hypothetical protein